MCLKQIGGENKFWFLSYTLFWVKIQIFKDGISIWNNPIYLYFKVNSLFGNVAQIFTLKFALQVLLRLSYNECVNAGILLFKI